MHDLILHIANEGLLAPDAALATNRIAVGLFFGISGFHKIANADRHARLVRTLTSDGVPWIKFNQWWVPAVELVGGIGLVLGVLAPVWAAMLIGICLVACGCEAREKVQKYGPIDWADQLDDYLYLPEVLYVIMLGTIILAGPGKWRLG